MVEMIAVLEHFDNISIDINRPKEAETVLRLLVKPRELLYDLFHKFKQASQLLSVFQ